LFPVCKPLGPIESGPTVRPLQIFSEILYEVGVNRGLNFTRCFLHIFFSKKRLKFKKSKVGVIYGFWDFAEKRSYNSFKILPNVQKNGFDIFTKFYKNL